MSAQSPAQKTADLIEKETNEHRTLNVQHRIMYSVNLKKTEQHAAYSSRRRLTQRERLRYASESTLRNSSDQYSTRLPSTGAQAECSSSQVAVFRSCLQRDSVFIK